MISKSKIKAINNLYKNKKVSAPTISSALKVSIKQVYYYLKKSGISRRSASQCNRLRFEIAPKSFGIKENLSQEERAIYLFCLAMYWCEGFHADSARGVDFANSNSKMILIFIHFLRNICRVDIKRIRCYLYCYSNQNPSKLVSYWSTVTGVPIEQFTKPYVRNDFRLDKINKMPYGLIHIRYYDKKLLYDIKDRINTVASELIMGGYRSSQTGQTVQKCSFRE